MINLDHISVKRYNRSNKILRWNITEQAKPKKRIVYLNKDTASTPFEDLLTLKERNVFVDGITQSDFENILEFELLVGQVGFDDLNLYTTETVEFELGED